MSEENEQKTCRFDVCCTCRFVCCQDAKPPLTLKRKATIKKYLKEQKILIENPFCNEAYSFPVLDRQDFCVLYDKKTAKCLVHPVKPETCKAGPVTFGINLKTGKIEWFLKKPGVCSLAKELNENSDALRKHFEAAKTQLTILIRELDSTALKAILKIEEPQTFKIGETDLPRQIKQKLNSNQFQPSF